MEAGTQFIGIKPEINMAERKSNVANNPTDVFTIEEIAEAINPYQSFVGYFTTYTAKVSYESLTIGDTYLIVDAGVDADFTSVGAPDNNVGTEFVATGADPNWGDPNAVLIDINESKYGLKGNFNSFDFTPEFTVNLFDQPGKAIVGIYFPYSVEYGRMFVNIPLFNDTPASFYFNTDYGDIQIASGNFIDQPIEIRLYN